ncbi:helix-turn-helix transcriptional regulator [Bradyrhizobium sp. BR 10289]|uniref:helix-turn-helix transcriptional regulator n=1 Tax=Bradyrhizobium sp. BR 10289 TaxID=2749993 RepID=UPI001C64C6B5|nr:helix-turn-helix transcriptional regulator [Bradyrhizobium sp. BR 10289]MBW7971842.1 helix-turn-helix transcriptional regulator [Bradyrhizobium sp. BR 10289]
MRAVERAFGEAVLDVQGWTKALEIVTSITESHGAVLLPVTGGTLRTLPFTEAMMAPFETYLRDGWHLRDERNRGLPLMRKNGVVDDLDIFSAEAIGSHPYYQEFLAPHRLRWFGGVGIFFDDDVWCLSIQRRVDQDPFSPAEKRELATLSNSLSTAAALARTVGGAAASGALQAFALSGTAAALVNRHGKIFEANQSAERLLGGDIRIKAGKLVSAGASLFADLELALSRVLNGRGATLHPPVPLPRKGRGPLLAYLGRPPDATISAFSNCQAIIVMVDPEARKSPPESTLRAVYGLSDAEARLSVQLSTGEPLEQAANRLGISKETSRTQLKNIFAKLGVHRQAELIAVLSTFLNQV